MTRKDTFLDKLRRQTPEALGVDEMLHQQQERWREDVKSLMQTLLSWLSEGAQQGLIKVEQRIVEVTEEDLGAYTIEGLKIQLQTAHPRIVQVEPRAMRIAGVVVASQRITGASGRVDLICGGARVMLLRMEGKGPLPWHIVKPDGTMMALSEEAFFDVLDELIQ